VSAVEHSAVLDTARALEDEESASVEVFGVEPDGTIDTGRIEEVLAGGPGVVSMMAVNNETGLRLPVEDVVAIARRHGAVVHCDAAQAVGKLPLSLSGLPVDLLTATGHKINGPKGTGILFVRGDTPVRPLVRGGGQERALRPGTEDVAGAVGFAAALRLAVEEQEATARHLTALRDTFEAAVRAALPHVRVNCAAGGRSPHVSSLGIPDADGSMMLMALDLEGVAASGGSACHSGSNAGSHVIRALYGADDPMATIRFSFGHGTTEADVLRAAEILAVVAGRFEPARQAGAS
jgi:cysteine desulfurase